MPDSREIPIFGKLKPYSMKKIFFLMAFPAMLSIVISCKSGKTKDQGVDPLVSHIDSTVKAGDDFFLFANGKWFKANPSVSAIPEKVDVVDVVVPPNLTEELVKECKKLGITRVWMQPGAESDAAVKYCKDNGIGVIYGACVMMN